jgi:alpha/beta superfamily hydrolase
MRPTIRAGSETLFVDGAAGRIETVLDLPAAGETALRGIALIAHPHPLFGGTLDNKVVQTLAKTFAELGYAAVRSNFRGVGETEGTHDHGEGETDDMLTLAAWARARFDVRGMLPVAAAGFSFGAWIQTRVAERLALQRLVLVALPAGFVSDGRSYTTGSVASDTIVIHGEQDETVPLANVFDWARPQDIAISVIPGADHFFHRKLKLIRSIIQGQWR